jgi:hypothetical protein
MGKWGRDGMDMDMDMAFVLNQQALWHLG